jgi:HD-GYP domain-containing protein (c-di-GMP phosphodiesterase class II)
VGYSASHALVCAVLCHLIAFEMGMAPKERDSLVRAALTMNIAMTVTQDILANQAEKPNQEQQDIIRTHPIKGAMMLANQGVADDVWLDVISNHHDDAVDKGDVKLVPTPTRLARILKMVDRYAAMISPRLSRAGRSATESARAVMAQSAKTDAIAHAMVRAVGLCPPGTYVKLDNEELAVVVRRSSQANHPYVVIVGKANGELWPAPRLHATSQGHPRIRAALPATAMRARLNHFHILQLSAYAAKES